MATTWSRTQLRRAGVSLPCPLCGEETVAGPCQKSHDRQRVRRTVERDLSDDAWQPTTVGAEWYRQWAAEHPEEAARIEAENRAALDRILARQQRREPPDAPPAV
jgi:hypothetical protein